VGPAGDFGGGPRPSAGRDDIFVARFDPSGVHQWSQQFGGPGDDDATAVATDAAGAVYVSGYFHEGLAVGPKLLQSAGLADQLLLKLSPAGVPLTGYRFGGPQDDVLTGVTVDGRGHLLVCGSFSGSIDLGGGPLHSAGEIDLVVARLAADGGHLWSHAYGGPHSDSATGISSDDRGGIAVSGYMQDSFDPGTGPLTSAGGYDAVLLRLAP
jgi:hypothetical protein